MACTYTLIDANGQQVTLNGPAEFKAYLVESGLKQFYPDGKYPWSPKTVEIQPSAQIDFKASQAFADRLINGESFKTIVQARKALTTQTIEAGTELAKKADEAIELAGVLAARRIVNQGMSQSETFDALTKIADQMPTLSVRTSESIAQQAYSTPLPLAYVASVRAGITKQTTVVEPTAGNGALVMAANPKLTTVNELNKSRFDSLNEQGFDAINDDAVDHNFGNRDADVVIANPPFGVIKDENNKTISFHIAGGYNTNEIDHAIALNALKAMSENGKAVLIVGGPSKMLSDEKRSDAYNGKAKRSFYFTLYNQYNVTDHFTVSGDLYAKQGAAWPVDVIVIEGIGKSNLQLPAANLPRIINSIEELKNELKGNQTGLQQAPVTVEQAARKRTATGDEGRDLAIESSTDTESNQNGQPTRVLSGLRGHTERDGSDGRNLRQQNDNISGRPARTDKPTDTVENKFQAPYRPGSAVNPVGTLVPVNMQASVETAIQRVIDKHGDLDTYVADLLDYPLADIGKYFSAEQVDAIALALDNIESGKGFIIGDQCVAGHTMIFDPISNTHNAIKSLAEQGKSINVLAMSSDGRMVPAWASAPFKKGKTTLYKIVLENGKEITVTNQHRFLSPTGWKTLKDGINVGDVLAYAHTDHYVHHEAGCYAHKENEPNYPKTTQDFQDDYQEGSHSYDEQHLSYQDSDQVLIPSLIDAQEHIRCELNLGDLGSLHIDTLCELLFRFSKNNSFPLANRDHELNANQERVSGGLLLEQIRQEPQQFVQWLTDHSIAFQARNHQTDFDEACWLQICREFERQILKGTVSHDIGLFAFHQQLVELLSLIDKGEQFADNIQDLVGATFSFGDYTGWTKVLSIENVGEDDFYDMWVPGYENYTAEGLINHNTGVGKGRVNAAMIRYAIKNSITPIFVTEKANLYGDMVRDLQDIGSGDVRPLATNSGASIPMDADANEWYEKKLQAEEKGEKAPAKYGKFLTFGTPAKQDKNMQAMAEKGSLIDVDVIFTTYSQMQTVKGAETNRMRFLEKMGDGALVIFDESHNAGGGTENKEGEAVGRAGMARKLVAISKGVFYSSATYAKRPDVLDLYSKTDMGLVANVNVLKESLIAGGIALQQSIASMLARSGQYIRREKSFDGIIYNTSNVEVDKNMAEKTSEIMREIMKFDDLKQGAIQNIKSDLKAEGSIITGDKATGIAGLDNTNFSSVMHNMIGQMLLILKTKPAIDEAIAALKRGEKPVITLSNTMGSVIAEYASDMGLNVGDAIDLDIGYLLKRYAQKSRRVTITNAYGEKETKSLSDDELGPLAVRQFNKIINLINDFDFSGFPISPIDYIHHELAKAGYKSNEITGRTVGADYTTGTPTYKTRPAQDKTPAGKRKIINDFNNGKIDVIILNQSGSTGISLHSSPKVGSDTRKRHMIVAQPELNIDTHMQMLGRINRTGQLNLPSYSQLAADIPAEKRPSAILAKKMAMLNANTTAGKESAVKAKDVPDFMNQYGDEIVAAVMRENPEVHKALGEPLGKDFDKEGAIAKVSGRIPVLTLKEQETLYQLIEDEYNDYIDTLNKTGENKLEASAMDLDAKTIKEEIVVQPIGDSDSPFAEAVVAKTVDAKKLGKPYSLDQIKELIAKQSITDSESKQKAVDSFLEKTKTEYQSALAEIDKMDDSDQLAIDRKNSALNTLNYQRDNLERMYKQFLPGRGVLLTSPTGMQYLGITGKFERKGTGKNYFAQGQWKVTVYVADASKQLVIPLSKLSQENVPSRWTIEIEPISTVTSALEEGLSSTREERVILTGNMLAAYGFNKTGQIVNYTDENGDVQQGVLMPKKFDLKKAIEAKPVIFDAPDMAIDFVNDMDVSIKSLRSDDNNVRLVISNSGNNLYVPASKAKGGMYFNNKRLTELLGNFVKRGSEMVVKVYPSEVQETIRALYQLVDSMQPVSKEEGKKFLEKKGIKFSKAKKSTGSTVAEVTAMLPKRVKKLINAGKLKIVQTSTERTEAYYDTKDDVLVLVADMLNKDNLESVLSHELLHRGLATDTKLKAAYDRFTDDLQRRFNLAAKGVGTQAEKAAYARVIAAETPKKDQLEEWGAYLVTEHQQNPQTVSSAIRKTIQDFVAAIRAFLIRNGFDMGFIKSLTPADLAAMANYGKTVSNAAFLNPSNSMALASKSDTITVDGVKRPILNSNGQPIHWSEEGIRNFWKWFGDSKVVDGEGKPMVVYHGTASDFSEFMHPKQKANPYLLGNDNEIGFFFTTEKGRKSDSGKWSGANGYAKTKQVEGETIAANGSNVMPVYLAIDSPYGFSEDEFISSLGRKTPRNYAGEIEALGFNGIKIGMKTFVAFDPTQIKSAIGNNGDFNPTNPDIRYSKQSPAEIADTLKQVFKPVEGKQELGWLAGFFQRNHLIDFVASELPEIKDYKLFAQEKDNFVNQSERVIAERYDEFKSKMNSKVMHELGRVQGLATRLANFDPAEANASDAMTDKEREVFDAYTAMPDSAKEVYKAMRDDYRKDLQTKKQALIQRIKDFKAGDKATAKIIKKIELHFDKFLTKGVYFPLNRDGNIVIVALDPDGEKTVQFVESNKERDNLIAAMKEQGYTDIKTSLKQTINRNVLIGNAANEIVGLADRTINDLRDAVDNGNLDEQEINAMFDEFNQLLLNALPDTSYRKHFIHRKGTLGESTDALRAYAKTRNSATRNIAALKFDSKIRNVLQQARKDVKKLNLENSQSIDGVLNELERREEALANTDTNVASQLLTSLGFMGALGFNIGSAAVNMMQVAGVTFPELAGKYSTKEAYSEIQKAYKLLFNPAVLNKQSGFDLTENPAINSITKKALAKLQDIGKIDLTMTHDAISAGQNPSYSENIINRTVGNFAKYSGYFFHVAEALNRQVTAIAAFNLAYAKNGGNFDAAIADTIDVIDRTQFDYGAGNRARYMMGNTARVLTLFKTYALGISYYIGRNVHNALKGESPEVRLQAKKTLAVQMAMTFATSGIFGLPLGIEAFMVLGGVAGFKYKGANFAVAGAVGGALVFQALLAGLGADDDDDLETQFRNWLTDNFDATTAEWITKGPARLLPIGDLSGRTGQRHLWWQPQNKQLEGTDQYNAFASAFMGPIGSQISSLFTAKKMYEDGQYSRMIESMSPAAIRNAVAAYRMSTEGVTTLKGQKIVKDLSYGDVINKTIGFTPNVIANAYDANSAIAKKRDKYEMQKTHLVNRYINADKEGRADLMANEIKAFNATVTREQQITMKSLLKSMKARKADGKHTEQGLYLSKKQESFREEGRFAKNLD